MPSLLIFPVNPVGATLAGIPLTTISKSYDWGGVFVVLELASLFCGCLLIGARNVNRHMIDPSKFEWIFYTNKGTWSEQPNLIFNLTFNLFTPGVKTWWNLGKVLHIFKLAQNAAILDLILTLVTHSNWNIQMTNEHFIFLVLRFLTSHIRCKSGSLFVESGWLTLTLMMLIYLKFHFS